MGNLECSNAILWRPLKCLNIALIVLFYIAGFPCLNSLPLATAEPQESVGNQVIEFIPVFADIGDFEPLDSHPYMLPESDEMLYSATRMMKTSGFHKDSLGLILQLLHNR